MIIQKITAEDVKYFKNETTLSTIEKAGGLSVYLKRFFTLAKNSEDILPQMGSIRINGEQIALAMDFDEQEEVMVSKINDIHIKKIKDLFGDGNDSNYKDAELVFTYNAYSEMDHTYYLTKDNKVLGGLECENMELYINEDTIPYFPLLAKRVINCDSLEFNLYNEDTGTQAFSYPELSVFIKNSDTPLIVINFWERELVESAEPDEVTYFGKESELVEEVTAIITETIDQRIQQHISDIVK